MSVLMDSYFGLEFVEAAKLSRFPASPNAEFPSRTHRAILDAAVSDDDYSAQLRRRELKLWPLPAYMDQQPELSVQHRFIVVEWLCEVSTEYRQQTDTFFLAVSILDRFLCAQPITKSAVQLLATACLWIAAKFEEVSVPSSTDLVMDTLHTYSVKELVRMEGRINEMLDFEFCVPTSKTFLRQYFQELFGGLTGNLATVYHLSSYLLELSLLEYEFVRFLPSHVAASALYLAFHTLGKPWDLHELCSRINCAPDNVNAASCLLYALHVQVFSGLRKTFISEKYIQDERLNVASIQPWVPIQA